MTEYKLKLTLSSSSSLFGPGQLWEQESGIGKTFVKLGQWTDRPERP